MFTVKYKKVNDFLWKRVTRVVGDQYNEQTRTRVFYLEDNAIVEVPVDGIVFKFGKERFEMIHKKMESEAGAKVPLRAGVVHSY